MTALQDSAQKQLKQFIEQIERLTEDKQGIQDDIKDKFAEAKAVGFDAKAMKEVLKMRRKSKTEREEMDSIITTYAIALGMVES
jgi:uncharacterized protein (UPF0335 family)